MKHCTILLAGRVEPTADLRAAVAGHPSIAADDGMRHAATLGLRPDLWVGDFDSGDPSADPGLADIEKRRFPADKDATDGEIAIEAALEAGVQSLLLVGALGGPRTDHAFAHLILALRLAERGIDVELFDGVERGWPLGLAPRVFGTRSGAQFSVLKFSAVTGLTIEGARFPLRRADIPFTSILTQSNEATGPVTASLLSGRAILLAQADPAVH